MRALLHLPRLVAIAAIVAALTACAPRPTLERHEFTRLQMGVQVRVTLYAPDEPTAQAAASAAFARIADLDATLSDYRPDSELMRLCAGAGPDQLPVAVSPDLYANLALGADIASATHGAFDVTVGPLVSLWRRARREGVLPDPGALETARGLVGWQLVALDPVARTARLARAGMRLDLGGIAKGYAADQAVLALRTAGTPRCLVALAGDIAAGEPPPGTAGRGRPPGWRIAISTGAEGDAPLSVHLANAAISTSGDTEQFLEIDGVRYSHIVDPRTGLGVTNRIAATVIAPSGAVADALASALCILGPEAAPRLVETFPGTAAIIRRADIPAAPPLILDPMRRFEP